MQKLSELMRAAALLNPTARGEFFCFDDDLQVVDMCALSACAVVASAGEYPEEGSFYRGFVWNQISHAIGKVFVWMEVESHQVPIIVTETRHELAVDNLIILLFDNHGWDCNQIADWLASIGL